MPQGSFYQIGHKTVILFSINYHSMTQKAYGKISNENIGRKDGAIFVSTHTHAWRSHIQQILYIFDIFFRGETKKIKTLSSCTKSRDSYDAFGTQALMKGIFFFITHKYTYKTHMMRCRILSREVANKFTLVIGQCEGMWIRVFPKGISANTVFRSSKRWIISA